MEHFITIRNGEQNLAATIHYPKREGDRKKWPLIVICHGFTGNRIGEDRLFVKAARALAKEQNLVIRFDYGGCGESTGDYGSSGFEDWIAQTRRVLDYGVSIDCVDSSQVILIGHSLGGAVAVLTAAKDHRVKSLVLWSAVAHPLKDIVGIVGRKTYQQAQQTGSADYLGYELKNSFFESLEAHKPLEELKHFKGNAYLVYGSNDEIISPEYCFLYQRLFWLRSDGQCDKDMVLQADHTFSSKGSIEQLLTFTKNWLHYEHIRKKEWNDWMI